MEEWMWTKKTKLSVKVVDGGRTDSMSFRAEPFDSGQIANFVRSASSPGTVSFQAIIFSSYQSDL